MLILKITSGSFTKKQDQFIFVPGHKVMLKYIVAFVTDQTNAKGPEFFKGE